MIEEKNILLGHGSGGLLSKKLVDNLFIEAYGADELLIGDDAAVFDLFKDENKSKVAFSTDSYVVKPLFFPGGDIGRLAVCGSVNDVATSGAIPKYMSISFILEESFEIDLLKKICFSIAQSASEAGIKIVTGDTKVVNKSSAEKVFINTSCIGIVNKKYNLSGKNCKPGDFILLSGTIGDHGITIMSQREGLKFSSTLKSDAAPLNKMVANVLEAAPDTRCFRDPTRGGIASSLNEFALQSNVDIIINQDDVPVKKQVIAACDMLGYDYMQVANEGKMLCVVPESQADDALKVMKNDKYGKDAAIIGIVSKHKSNNGPKVYVDTGFGTKRILDMLVGEQLPRIC